MSQPRRTLRSLSITSSLIGLFAASAFFTPNCSLVVDGTVLGCETTADCVSFPGTTCNDGECSAAQDECATNADCASLGEFAVCRDLAPRKCVSLKSDRCTIVEGDWLNDDAILVGVLAPLAGDNESTGRSILNGARLAAADINIQALPPAPGQTARRPLVLVGCDDGADRNTALVAANHLTDEVGVQAILGPAFSGITLHVATQSTVQKGVLLMSSSATSKLITDLPDADPSCVAQCAADAACAAGCPGLVWRTSPSDIIQAAALAQYFASSYEAEVRGDIGDLTLDPPFTGMLKVAVAFKGDAYGASLKEELEQQLRFNSMSALEQSANYKPIDYGNPDDPTMPTKYEATVSALIQEQPHIILVFGTDEGVTQIFSKVEAGWTGTIRPHWVFSDGGLLNALSAEAKTANAAARVRGTVPGTNNANFQAFVSQYNSQFTGETVGGPQVFGAAGAYDIVYLLGYSAVAAGDAPLTGGTFAAGFSRMIGGPQTRVGKGNINAAIAALSSGGSIDFDGASGPLAFDLATGEAVSDIQIWCLPKPDGQGNIGLGIASGVEYANAAISGSLKTTCSGQ